MPWQSPQKELREFAFDVKLLAVARVRAETEEQARAKLNETVECVDLAWSQDGVTLTETSVLDKSEPAFLFDPEGEPIAA